MTGELRSRGNKHDAVAAHTRALLLVGSALRIAYGAGAVFAPTQMAARQYAPDTHGLADPRLLLRAFGAHQIVTACLTLGSIGSPPRARAAATLSLLIDTSDVVCAMLEQRARGTRDKTTTGGYAISGAGMLTFALAACLLQGSTSPARSAPAESDRGEGGERRV